jgi:predicted acyltransferase
MRSPRRVVSRLVAWAVVLVATGWLASLVVPAMKRLWTPGFGLGVAAAAVVALALGFVLLDLPTSSRWQHWRHRLAWPHVAMGRNSLLVYFGSHIVVGLLVLHGGDSSYAVRLAASMDVLGHPPATFVAANIALWAAIAAVLHRRGIYLRP